MIPGVGARRRAVVQGEARGRAAVGNVARELDEAIQSHGLSYAAVGRDIGLSGSQVSRAARGLAPDLSIVQASTLLAAVGLDLSVRAFPTGRPLRDRAHVELLEALSSKLHPSLTWRTEVPVMPGRDLRAWDAVIRGADWTVAVEAETRLRDIQALERRIELKRRDGGIDAVLLLIRRTRHNQAIVRSLGSSLVGSYPVPGRRARELIGAGVHPGRSSIVLL